MAIPKFYSVIQRKWPSIVRKLHGSKLKCDHLCIDFGSIVHNCFQFALNEEEIIANSTRYICEIIEIVQPKTSIYIALDGVPPIAKVKEQSHRRKTNALNSSGGLDRNILSPGTVFSEKLNKEIAKLGDSYESIEFVVSTSDVDGEGEQKIMNYVSSLDSSNDVVIYGLDADLIVLSLRLEQKITIMREDYKSFLKVSREKEFETLSIVTFEACLKKEFGISTRRKINDAVLVLCLLGNDFLLRPFRLSVDVSILNILFASLKSVHTSGKFLISAKYYDIDQDGFKGFCDELYQSFFQDFKSVFPMSKSTETEEILTLSLQNLSLKERKSQMRSHIDSLMKSKYEDWKLETYPGLQKKTKKEIAEVTKDYLIGLQWLIKYYMEGKTDKYWIYNHEFAPVLSDLSDGLASISLTEEYEKLPKSIDLKPADHLCLITPKSSWSLLPKEYQKFLDKIEFRGDYEQLLSIKKIFDQVVSS